MAFSASTAPQGSFYFNPQQQASVYVPASTPMVNASSQGQPYQLYSQNQPVNYTPPRTGSVLGLGTSAGSYSQPSNPQPSGTQNTAPAGPSLDQQINDIYGGTSGLLDQIEANTNAGKQDFLNSFTKQYDAQLPLLQQQRDVAQQNNTNQQGAVNLQAHNALDSARQLYNELAQGVQQRFGGSSSAGDFANAILGRQYQQNQGNITNTQGQNIKSLQDQYSQIGNQYQASLTSLNAQKEAALAQAQDLFRQRIDAINQSRIGLAQDKAQAKLQALQQLQQQAFYLQYQHQQYVDQLNSYAQNALQQAGGIQSAYGNYLAQSQPTLQNTPASSYSSIGSPALTTNNALNLQGSMGRGRIDPVTGRYLPY